MEPNPSEKDSFVSRLTEIIESNLNNEQFGVTELAREMGMSRSNLHRKVKAITNSTISQLLCQIRLKKALELLRESSTSVTEVAIECGFNSLSYFTKCFKKYYGVPPSKFSKIEVTVTFPHEVSTAREKKSSTPIKKLHLWLIITLLLLLSTVLLILLVYPGRSNPVAKEKIIAVLPLSKDDLNGEDAFLADGLINEIRYKLSLVGDLTVLSRTSVESYRNNRPSTEEIGKELKADYILECKAHNSQGSPWISIQLIDVVNTTNLWSEPFERELSLHTIFQVQEDAALAVIKDLNTDLTLEEKERIKRYPTEDRTAYNVFLLGKNYVRISQYSLDKETANEAMRKAKLLFEQAIALDSTFAEAYSALGSIYINHNYKMTSGGDLQKRRQYLDSALILLDKALYYDSENVLALQKKAEYYEKIGLHRDADRIYENLSKRGELSYEYYEDEVMKFPQIKDYYGILTSYQKYLELKPEELIVSRYMLRKLFFVFQETGFPELERQMAEQLFDIEKDSALYLRRLVSSEIYQRHFNSAIDYALEALNLKPSRIYYCDLLALCHAYLQDYRRALDYLVRTDDSIRRAGPIERPGYIPGYIYLMNGYEAQANFHFRRGIDRRLKEIDYAEPNAQQGYSHFDLAGIYLALGDENKALAYLKELKKLEVIDYDFINMMKNWPGFESIRHRPEFQEVLAKLEDTYQKQHRRIEELVKELEFLPL